MEPPNTPVCDKLLENDERARTVQEFLEFLQEKELAIAACEEGRDRWGPVCLQPSAIIHQFLDIDEDELEKERRALLEYQRWCNKHHKVGRDYGIPKED